ncbi:hypothetical protein BDK51DRAFT_29376 [Blyttiomyces helicus]|uniref:Uncharacterized protein n=1 Tax=Blyttiomyces helicus TaxID=388810 RepID=A0A4P9VWG3_9FUNG|nr:hypothetical protein BDK51DRAFT_29376 [Blyttiomyces helicus]|eukprot:RKO83502.1 hypothetical protein BDK51DRAFT_29376 [Blyttiomyces helicus]
MLPSTTSLASTTPPQHQPAAACPLPPSEDDLRLYILSLQKCTRGRLLSRVIAPANIVNSVRAAYPEVLSMPLVMVKPPKKNKPRVGRFIRLEAERRRSIPSPLRCAVVEEEEEVVERREEAVKVLQKREESPKLVSTRGTTASLRRSAFFRTLERRVRKLCAAVS